MTDDLRAWAEKRGYAVAWGPASVLGLARQELARREQDGEIEATFARENLSFAFEGDVPRDWNVLVVAVPRPAHRVRFIVDNTPIDAIMPPTYYRFRPIIEDVRQDLAELVFINDGLVPLSAPLKTLASLLGLVRYGRNNVVYAPGMGSYLQLFGYATDATLTVEPGWTPHEPGLLDECAQCGICTALCPTGAIDPTRVLLRAERCLTLATEAPGPWPPHLSADHLIGCLLCQRHCPANPELQVADSGVAFTEAETQALLADDDGAGTLWDSIRTRIDQLGQPELRPVISRNLRALLGRAS